MLDKEKVLNACTAEEVANLIGMETFRKGKNTYIYCPGHRNRLGKEDSKPTNAILTPHGYKCYACGCRVNTIDMVAEYTGMPFYEALKYVASLIGGEEYYQQDKEIKAKSSSHIPLSNSEYELLGIPTNACKYGRINHISPEKDDKMSYTYEYLLDEEVYVSYDPTVTFSIRDLFLDDYPFYCLMIRNCAENRIQQIANKIKQCRNADFLLSIGIKTKEMQERLIEQYKKMMKDVYHIYVRYCKEETPVALKKLVA